MSDSVSKTPFNLASADLQLGRSYLLLGADAYLADKALQSIRTTFENGFDADTTIIYADDIKHSLLSEHLDAFSIFSSAKLIVIRNAEKFGKKELEVLSEYFDEPSDIQSIVVIAEKIDARLSAWKKIKSSCTLVVCDPPRYGGVLREWLETETKKIGKKFSSKAAEEFIARIDLDYYYAANELNKLDLLSANRTQITETDVLKSLGTTRMGTLIDFYRALGKRSPKLSLDALQLMMAADWEALQVLFHFYKFYAIIWRILLLKKSHLSDSEIISKHLMDLFQTQRKEFLDFSKHYSLDSVEKIFAILLDTDAKYKLSAAESNILLSRCLIEVLNS